MSRMQTSLANQQTHVCGNQTIVGNRSNVNVRTNQADFGNQTVYKGNVEGHHHDHYHSNIPSNEESELKSKYMH